MNDVHDQEDNRRLEQRNADYFFLCAFRTSQITCDACIYITNTDAEKFFKFL